MIRTRDDPPGAESPADLDRQAVAGSTRLGLGVLELLEHLRATDHRDVVDVPQIGGHRLSDTRADPVVSRIAGHVRKRQHGDRSLAGFHMRSRSHARRGGAALDLSSRVT